MNRYTFTLKDGTIKTVRGANLIEAAEKVKAPVFFEDVKRVELIEETLDVLLVHVLETVRPHIGLTDPPESRREVLRRWLALFDIDIDGGIYNEDVPKNSKVLTVVGTRFYPHVYPAQSYILVCLTSPGRCRDRTMRAACIRIPRQGN